MASRAAKHEPTRISDDEMFQTLGALAREHAIKDPTADIPFKDSDGKMHASEEYLANATDSELGHLVMGGAQLRFQEIIHDARL